MFQYSTAVLVLDSEALIKKKKDGKKPLFQ